MRNRLQFIPGKTSLAVLTFVALSLLPDVAPPLRDYYPFDWRLTAAVFSFPLRKPTTEPLVEEQARLRPDTVRPGATTTEVIDPTSSLDHFYAALQRTEQRRPDAVTRILHYGDSPTTADLITADVRLLLQTQFGDAGHGFCLIAKPWAWYGHRGLEISASNWKIDPATQPELRDGLFGLGGVSFRGGPNAVSHIRVTSPRGLASNSSYTTIEVAYLAQPGGGEFAIQAGEHTFGTVQTDADSKRSGYASFPIPGGATRLTVEVTRGSVRLFGVQLLKPAPGVVYSSLGLNGANISVLTKTFQKDHWAEQLRHYQPDLVIVNYGTNESGYPKFVDYAYGKELKEVVRRLRAALPETSILLMSPMDRGQREANGEIGTVTAMPRLVMLEQQTATDMGCAFFNTFEAMGGAGTMGRWYEAEPRLVGADFIHPMPAGAKIVGGLLYQALFHGYNRYKLRQLQHQILSQAEPSAVAKRGR